ncbi:hypothetical protein [Mangrovibacterium marinum]|uniref:Addiction module component n=1 Tax=Mangrovibacterium marinum TaxID=1639118 RepID=A0A2T5C1F0_9BACT|nr:hypothetical protein [Mangrovibacterium marinum]PTN08467.1 hypothetical protein C8N47_10824 [Mangrovibacterium marinum]
MKITDLKHKLIHRIKQSQNDVLLEELYRMLTDEDDSGILELTPEQKKAVEEGREQYRTGQFLSQKQADEEIDEWLDK